MSSKRLAAVVAAGQAGSGASATQKADREHQPLKGNERTPHVNLLLTSVVLGGMLVLACLVCYCCGRRRTRHPYRTGTAKGTPGPSYSPYREASPSIYTLQPDCPYTAQFYEPSSLPPYRRPPTPGPPPAYESVVSKSDKYRKFGEDDDGLNDLEGLLDHRTNEINHNKEIAEQETMSSIDKLRHCKIHGNCTIYAEKDTIFDIDGKIENVRNKSLSDEAIRHFGNEDDRKKLRGNDVIENEHIFIQINDDPKGEEESEYLISISTQTRKATEEPQCSKCESKEYEVQEISSRIEIDNQTAAEGESHLETLQQKSSPAEESNGIFPDQVEGRADLENKVLAEDVKQILHQQTESVQDESLPTYEAALCLEGKRQATNSTEYH